MVAQQPMKLAGCLGAPRSTRNTACFGHATNLICARSRAWRARCWGKLGGGDRRAGCFHCTLDPPAAELMRRLPERVHTPSEPPPGHPQDGCRHRWAPCGQCGRAQQCRSAQNPRTSAERATPFGRLLYNPPARATIERKRRPPSQVDVPKKQLTFGFEFRQTSLLLRHAAPANTQGRNPTHNSLRVAKRCCGARVPRLRDAAVRSFDAAGGVRVDAVLRGGRAGPQGALLLCAR
eukprot:363371-Chlamydomonas_euryale.AAC.20